MSKSPLAPVTPQKSIGHGVLALRHGLDAHRPRHRRAGQAVLRLWVRAPVT